MEIIKPGYVRVSEILNSMNDFGDAPPDILENAKKRGRMIHEALDAHFDGLYLPLGKWSGYFDSIMKWLEITKFEILRKEERLYDHHLKITGRFDALVTGGIIVDWKNVANLNKRYCELQGMFYHHLASINGLKPAERYMFVQPDPDGGTPSVFTWKASHVTWNECLKKYYEYKGQKVV